jgi:predicted DNA-binding antitoxin AbrB/MazE fold protein
MPVIHAVYENGVFRPTEPVDLPESSEVEVELRRVTPRSDEKRLDTIYTILEERFESAYTPAPSSSWSARTQQPGAPTAQPSLPCGGK